MNKSERCILLPVLLEKYDARYGIDLMAWPRNIWIRVGAIQYFYPYEGRVSIVMLESGAIAVGLIVEEIKKLIESEDAKN